VRRLPIAMACMVALTPVAPALGQDESRPEYLHTLYWAAIRPTAFNAGKPVVDLTTPERVFPIVQELSELGVNVITYHSVYSGWGALFPVDDPLLTEAWYWPEGAQPVDTFLDACARYGVDGYLGLWLGQEGHPTIAAHAIDAIIDRYAGRPGFAGIAPPIEAPYTNITTDDFIDLSAQVKRRDPRLMTMDYPPSPYSFKQLQWLMKLAGSGVVDIENVQFHPCDDRLADLREARGLTLLTMGCCPGIRSIIHTHYKNGVNNPPEHPTQWLPPERAWDVTQSAIITATPDGTSIFSFLHGFWGEESGPGGGDAMWRRLKWYEGIVGVQRTLPLYAFARNAARVQIMVPTGTLEDAQDLLARCWAPPARGHIPTGFFVDERNLPPEAEVIIVPDLQRCDATQGRLVQRFAAGGGTVILTGGLHASTSLYQSLAEAGVINPHVREVLDLNERPDVAPGDLDAEFARLIGFQGGPLPEPEEPVRHAWGDGAVIVAPGGTEWAAAGLGSLVLGALPDAMRVTGLPDGWMIEQWRAEGGGEFLALFGIEEGQVARDVRIELPGTTADHAWLVTGEGSERVPVENEAVTLGNLGDSFALLAPGDLPAPILRPAERRIDCRAGDTVIVRATVLNATGARAAGTLSADGPEGWAIAPAEADFNLAAGERARVEFAVSVPAEVVRRPWFIRLEINDDLQRVIVFPEDGAPQVISELTGAPPGRPHEARAGTSGDIGDEWMSVTAGELLDNVVGRHTPGVCFYGAEWTRAREQAGRMARYGELIRPRMGGPNFWINEPDRERDLLVRVTYLTPDGGALQVYDGTKYHTLGELAASDRWQTGEWRVSREIYAGDEADYSRTFRGFNLLGQFACPRVFVHEIAVRAAE